MSLRERLFHSLLALEFLLSLLQYLDAFHVWYFPMKERFLFSLRFDLGFSLVPFLLPIAFLVLVFLLWRGDSLLVLLSLVITLVTHFFFSFEAAVAVFSLIQVALALYRFIDLNEFLFWFLVLITGFEALALIHWVLLPFGITTPLNWFANLELDLFYVMACFSPYIVLIFMCMWFLKPLSNYLGINRMLKLESGDDFSVVSHYRIRYHLLGLAVFFAIIGALYPYSPAINPNSTPVGVDVVLYEDWMAEVEKDLHSAFTVERGSRPVILLLIYAIQIISRAGSSVVIKFLPILLNPLLVLSVYFMVSQASQNHDLAAISSLLTGLGYKITVGMFSYYLANILGLILIFTSIGFLFNSIRTKNYFYLVIASVFGSLCVFNHPWTFIQYYAAVVLFLLYRYFIEKKHEGCLIILIYICTTGLADFIKGVIVDGLASYGSIGATPPEFINILKILSNNTIAFRLRYGGLLSVTIPLCIAVYGVYKLKRNELFHSFLASLLVVSSLYYFVIGGELQSRLIYNLPIGVLVALGVMSILRLQYNDDLKKLFFLFLFLHLIVYMLRSLGNLI